MKVHELTVGSFVPMLESLGEWVSVAHQKNVLDARLAPDMYTLAQQVQQACHHARDAVSRLSGAGPVAMTTTQKTMPRVRAQIAKTIDELRALPAAAFDGAEKRDCSIPTPDGRLIRMNGARFVRAWAIPHFYFHVVTAYGILRHVGVPLGVENYLSQVGPFIEEKKPARVR